MNPYKPDADETGTRADAADAAWIVSRVALFFFAVAALCAGCELFRTLTGGAL